MRFTNSELEMIYQYAAPTKAETIGGMKETVPVIKDLLTRVIMEPTNGSEWGAARTLWQI